MKELTSKHDWILYFVEFKVLLIIHMAGQQLVTLLKWNTIGGICK